jgi:hypothetical protein
LDSSPSRLDTQWGGWTPLGPIGKVGECEVLCLGGQRSHYGWRLTALCVSTMTTQE